MIRDQMTAMTQVPDRNVRSLDVGEFKLRRARNHWACRSRSGLFNYPLTIPARKAAVVVTRACEIEVGCECRVSRGF